MACQTRKAREVREVPRGADAEAARPEDALQANQTAQKSLMLLDQYSPQRPQLGFASAFAERPEGGAVTVPVRGPDTLTRTPFNWGRLS
jgi:hypothetical protein